MRLDIDDDIVVAGLGDLGVNACVMMMGSRRKRIGRRFIADIHVCRGRFMMMGIDGGWGMGSLCQIQIYPNPNENPQFSIAIRGYL